MTFLPTPFFGLMPMQQLALSPAAILGSSLAAWFDMSDPYATCFQDFTSTAAAVGQPVALQLDKRPGVGALGAELVTNGDFSAGSTGWTLGTGAAVSSGGIQQPNGTGSYSWQQYTTTAARIYKLTYTIVSGQFYCGVWATGPTNASIVTIGNKTAGTYTQYFVATASTATFSFTCSGTTTGTIDNISVKEVLGTPRYQSTLAQRPILGRMPKSGRRNKCENYNANPTDLTGVTKSGDAAATLTVVDDSAALAAAGLSGLCPSGKVYKLDNSAGTTSVDAVIGGGTASTNTHTISVYAKRIGSGGSLIQFRGTGTATANITATSYTRVSGTGIPALGNVMQVKAAAGDVVYFILNQLEEAASASAVQTVAGAYDCTEVPYDSCYYLQADGFDDFYTTPDLDLTATDKVAVFAGLRKLSNAARGMFVELGSAPATAAFQMNVPVTTGGEFSFASFGSLQTSAVSGAYSAPYTAVVTSVGGIPTDTCILRINGTQAASSSADQGTGNYSNNPLYFYRRGGSSLPAKVCDFGCVLATGTLTSAQITAMERYIARNTPEVNL